MLGPEANELVLFHRDKSFSSSEGWGSFLGHLFPLGRKSYICRRAIIRSQRAVQLRLLGVAQPGR